MKVGSTLNGVVNTAKVGSWVKKMVNAIRPVEYGPFVMRNPRAEQAIEFLEDPENNDKSIPPDLLLDSELDYVERYGKLEGANFIRRKLQGGTIG